jgi:N-acetyl-anhydromuramyl-L-alanine amidase AmpD
MINWIERFGCPNGLPVSRDSVDCVVIHYTAGSLDSTLNWFFNPASKVSSHLVIGRDGDVYELFKPDCIAWHAGVSSWRGRSSVNKFSYGIELVATAEDGFTFTDEQYEAIRVALWGGKVLSGNGKSYDRLGVATEYGLSDISAGTSDAEILGHEHVAPGRKVDPGPNFEWSRISKAGYSLNIPPVSNVDHQVEATEVSDKPLKISENKPLSLFGVVTRGFRLLIRALSGTHKSRRDHDVEDRQ